MADKEKSYIEEFGSINPDMFYDVQATPGAQLDVYSDAETMESGELKGYRGTKKYIKMWKFSALPSAASLIHTAIVSGARVYCKKPKKKYVNSIREARKSYNILVNNLEKVIESIPDASTAGPIGFMTFEILLSLDPNTGVTNIKRLIPIPQETVYEMLLDDEGYLDSLTQLDNVHGLNKMPGNKFWHIRYHNDRDNPRGKPWNRAILRNDELTWNLENVENRGIEVDLNGIPLITVPHEMTLAKVRQEYKDTLEAMKTLGANLASGKARSIVMPSEIKTGTQMNSGFGVKLLTTNGTRAVDPSKAIERHDMKVLIGLGCEWILMGFTGKGAGTVRDGKMGMTEQAGQMGLSKIISLFNKQVRPILMYANDLFDKANWSEVAHGKVDAPNVTQLADGLSKFRAAGGFVIDEEALEHVRTELDMAIGEDSLNVEKALEAQKNMSGKLEDSTDVKKDKDEDKQK